MEGMAVRGREGKVTVGVEVKVAEGVELMGGLVAWGILLMVVLLVVGLHIFGGVVVEVGVVVAGEEQVFRVLVKTIVMVDLLQGCRHGIGG